MTKLLLDQNLSRRLVEACESFWPGMSHVSVQGLATATDKEIRDFAASRGYAIVSKDNDFLHHAFLHGAPPKIIMISLGNASTTEIKNCLLAHRQVIDSFLADPLESALIIP